MSGAAASQAVYRALTNSSQPIVLTGCPLLVPQLLLACRHRCCDAFASHDGPRACAMHSTGACQDARRLFTRALRVSALPTAERRPMVAPSSTWWRQKWPDFHLLDTSGAISVVDMSTTFKQQSVNRWIVVPTVSVGRPHTRTPTLVPPTMYMGHHPWSHTHHPWSHLLCEEVG